MVPKGRYDKEVALNQEFLDTEGITSVISYTNTIGQSIPDEFVPESKLSQLYSQHYSRFIISLDTEEGREECFELVDKVKQISESYYGTDYVFAGDLVSTEDLMKAITADDIKVNFLAILFVFIILVVTFKSVTIPIILTVVIETSIWINLSIPYFTGKSIYYMGYLIISSVQLGATIDYAILFTERYKEHRMELAKIPAVIE